MPVRNATPKGITRPIDKMGRVSVPREMYTALNISTGDSVDIFSGVDSFGFPAILIQKSPLTCANCSCDLTPATSFVMDRITICMVCAQEVFRKFNRFRFHSVYQSEDDTK